MQTAGFVLVGGKSRRMGQDKALLPWGGGALVQDIAAKVATVSGSVALIGAPHRYGDFGFSCLEDLRPGLGPLSGLETALQIGRAEWNLIVACDMPNIGIEDLQRLCKTAEMSEADCVVTADVDGRIHPLCALYRDRCLPTVQKALDSNKLRVMDFVHSLVVEYVYTSASIQNVNTSKEWDMVRAADV